jgi:hypothetical protein
MRFDDPWYIIENERRRRDQMFETLAFVAKCVAGVLVAWGVVALAFIIL